MITLCACWSWRMILECIDINVTKVIDFPNVVSVWVTLFEVDEVVGGGGGGGLLAGHHAELEAVLRCLRAEVARHGHARRHVAHRPRLLVRAQADQVPIRLLTRNIFYRNRNTFDTINTQGVCTAPDKYRSVAQFHLPSCSASDTEQPRTHSSLWNKYFGDNYYYLLWYQLLIIKY